MSEPVPPAPSDDPNVTNPYRSPLEPGPNDPFSIPEDADEMPVQHPTPGGVPPAPVPEY